jgi:CheY-like chemotaxis protein
MSEDATRHDGPIHVLVIDDDPDMRQMIAQVMLEHGHLAVTAASAEEALAMLPHYTFQIACVDHNLPGMEGLVFGEWLTRNNPHICVALITGEDDEDLRDRCEEEGIAFVAKPFGVSDLTALVTRYAERARARREDDADQVEHEFFDPPIARYHADLDAYFDLPSIPDRIEERLVRRIRDALANLHSTSRYDERERVAALSGLLAARVLGIRLPRGRNDQTLYEEYDHLMDAYGRRAEFGSIDDE